MDATKVCFHRVTWTLVCLIFVLSDNVLGQEKVTFEDHIKPMFRTRCAACHNPDKKKWGLGRHELHQPDAGWWFW